LTLELYEDGLNESGIIDFLLRRRPTAGPCIPGVIQSLRIYNKKTLSVSFFV
jgi:hypothetical protein